MLVGVYVRELLKLVINNNGQSEGHSVSKVYDMLETQLRALESLGMTSEKYASMMYPLVESSLPEETLQAWQRSPLLVSDHTEESQQKSTLSRLMEFLCQEVENEDHIDMDREGFGLGMTLAKDKSAVVASDDKLPTAAGLHAGEAKNPTCVFCDGGHESPICGKARSLSIEDRKEKVKAGKAGFICLKRGHGAMNCRAHLKCLVCSKKHYEIMCPEIYGQKVKQANPKSDGKVSDKKVPENKAEEGYAENKFNVNNIVCTRDVLLRTQLVSLSNGDGKKRNVRVLYDSGGQRSYTA